MPDFIFDVQGLGTTSGIPDGGINAFAATLFSRAAGESFDLDTITSLFGNQETSSMFPVVYIRRTTLVESA